MFSGGTCRGTGESEAHARFHGKAGEHEKENKKERHKTPQHFRLRLAGIDDAAKVKLDIPTPVMGAVIQGAFH
jgi:hypothetical protein